MNPNLDILGLEKDCSVEEIEAAYKRLYVIFERNDELDSGEFADIEGAFKALPENEETIDRTVWEWVERKDRNGSWNTLVRKMHRLKKRAEAASTWDSKEGRDSKKDKIRGRKLERGRRSGGFSEE